MPFTATNANIEKDQPFVLVSLNMLLREKLVEASRTQMKATRQQQQQQGHYMHFELPIQIPLSDERDAAYAGRVISNSKTPLYGKFVCV